MLLYTLLIFLLKSFFGLYHLENVESVLKTQFQISFRLSWNTILKFEVKTFLLRINYYTISKWNCQINIKKQAIKLKTPKQFHLSSAVFFIVHNKFQSSVQQYFQQYFIVIINMEKQKIKSKYQLKDLPPHLQKKYKNSILFQKENQHKVKKFQFDLKNLKERKAEKQKTIQEKLQEFKINLTQQKYLINVFNQLSQVNNQQFFTKNEICDVLKKMQIKMTNSQIDRMIWEFDQKLNKKISLKEFVNMYKKCTIDKTAAQSKNLFHLTQFLMFCRPYYYNITVEDTLELLYVRAKIQGQIQKRNERQILQEQIKVIFGDEQKTPEGVQKQICFKEYLEKINKRAIEKRKQDILKAKANLKY